MASTLNGTGITFSDGTAQPTRAATSVDVQTFNSTAVWTKPTGGQTMCRIQLWGGGGGGGRRNDSTVIQAGGGGGYNEVTVPLAYINSQTVTVGAGGAGFASTAGNGTAGGTSTVTLATAWNGVSTWSAYGGGGGGGTGAQQPGGGGGQTGAGGTNTGVGGTPSLTSGSQAGSLFQGNQPLDIGGVTVAPTNIYHGGSGAGASTGPGGSVWGGGGGANFNTGANAGGKSLYGGQGGGSGAAGTMNGAAPGGGGGASGSVNVTGGTGGAGRIIITSW